MLHGEDRKGQLGLGVARVIAMVIVALLEEGVVCGLIRHRFPQAPAARACATWARCLPQLCRGAVGRAAGPRRFVAPRLLLPVASGSPGTAMSGHPKYSGGCGAGPPGGPGRTPSEAGGWAPRAAAPADTPGDGRPAFGCLGSTPTCARGGGPHPSQRRDGPPIVQMSRPRLGRTEAVRSKRALGRSSRFSARPAPGTASVPGDSWVSSRSPKPHLLFLGTQHPTGEQLQALAGEVDAQLLQAIHPQGLGACGQ